jgi:hypothetical protein
MEIEATGHLFHERHATQHFGLGRHHGVGDRISPQYALQLVQLVLARVVQQGAGSRVERRYLADGDVAQQWHQQDRCKQRQLAPPQYGNDGCTAQSRPVMPLGRRAPLRAIPP